jgi:hypothetical protein
MSTATSAIPPQSVRSAYRTLARLIEQLPPPRQPKSRTELRQKFRRPLDEAVETLEDRLKAANDRISFLRITTPKSRNEKRAGVFVFKDGKLVEEGQTTNRDANGRVISNWDGKNLDPCAVNRHRTGLKRAGFVNNLHAKGIF